MKRNKKDEELSKQFEATFKKEGGEILLETFYIKGDTSFSKQIEEFKKIKPELIFIPGYVREVTFFIKEAFNKGLKTIYLGSDGWYSPLIISSLKNMWISFKGKREPLREIFILKPEENEFKFFTKIYFE